MLWRKYSDKGNIINSQTTKLVNFFNLRHYYATMHVGHICEVEEEPVDMGEGTYIQWLITEKEGALNYIMRRFVIKPGGYIKKHNHPYEHEIYVIKGKGIIGHEKRGEIEVSAGSFAFIEPDVTHWYRNIGDEDWEFICIIPKL